MQVVVSSSLCGNCLTLVGCVVVEGKISEVSALFRPPTFRGLGAVMLSNPLNEVERELFARGGDAVGTTTR